MLSYALAIAVAISSLVLFLTAFLMSGIHRKDDFLWGAVGLFYALVLWYCARNITGAVLLGQAAATVLVVSYSWQTIKLRQAMQRVIASPKGTVEGGSSPQEPVNQEASADSAQANETNNFSSVIGSINGLLKRRKPQVQPPAKPLTKTPTPKVTEEDLAIPETPVEISEPTTTTKKAQDQAQDINPPVANEQVNVPDAKPLVEVVDKTTPGSKVDPENQVSQPAKTELLPFPNKLPEVVKTTKIESVENETATDNILDSQPVLEDSKPELETDDVSKEASNEVKDSIPVKEVEPKSELTSPETAKSTKPKSALDSLETVEVAEVLEAESDRQSNNRKPDRFNIIEVTTTEINVTTEVIKTDQNQDSDSDFKEM
jgi:hypothetical protein